MKSIDELLPFTITVCALRSIRLSPSFSGAHPPSHCLVFFSFAFLLFFVYDSIDEHATHTERKTDTRTLCTFVFAGHPVQCIV